MKSALCFLMSLAILAACAGCAKPAETAAPSAGPTRLVISAGLEFSQELALRAALPEVELTYCDRINADELARLLAARDDSVDIYRLPADCAYTAMVAKGMTADLSGSAVLRAEAESLDPAIRCALLDGSGRISAWPASLQIYFSGVNEPLWRQTFGDRPLPATYGDLLDAWIDWETDLAGRYPERIFANIADGFDYAYTVRLLVEAYVRQHDADGPPDMRADSLRSALEKLEAVRDARLANGRGPRAEGETGPEFLACLTTRRALDDFGEANGSRITWLPLAFDGASVLCADAYMEAYAVNPYSLRAEAAVRAIERLAAAQTDPGLYCALHPERSQPYENPSYDPDRQGEAFRRYLVSAEAIAEYRGLTQSRPLNLHADSPYFCEEGTAMHGILQSACQRYADGALTLDGLLDELTAKTAMMHLENAANAASEE